MRRMPEGKWSGGRHCAASEVISARTAAMTAGGSNSEMLTSSSVPRVTSTIFAAVSDGIDFADVHRREISDCAQPTSSDRRFCPPTALLARRTAS